MNMQLPFLPPIPIGPAASGTHLPLVATAVKGSAQNCMLQACSEAYVLNSLCRCSHCRGEGYRALGLCLTCMGAHVVGGPLGLCFRPHGMPVEARMSPWASNHLFLTLTQSCPDILLTDPEETGSSHMQSHNYFSLNSPFRNATLWPQRVGTMSAPQAPTNQQRFPFLPTTIILYLNKNTTVWPCAIPNFLELLAPNFLEQEGADITGQNLQSHRGSEHLNLQNGQGWTTSYYWSHNIYCRYLADGWRSTTYLFIHEKLPLVRTNFQLITPYLKKK